MLTQSELGRLLESASSSTFRFEAQPEYDVKGQRGYLDAYLAGEELDLSRRLRWLETLWLRAERGVEQRHLRVLRLPLSDYDRMACEWGYVYNTAAGLDVRVLLTSRDEQEPESWKQDFYLIDRMLVRMHYDETGRFLTAGVDDSPDGPADRVVENLWEQGEPFAQWWAGHPEYHRQVLAR